MFKLLIASLFFTFNLFGRWHSCYSHPPKPGQLYMYVVREQESYFDRKTIIITHYNPEVNKRLPFQGWYDVNKNDVFLWMKKGYVIYVLPRKYRTDKQRQGEWDG